MSADRAESAPPSRGIWRLLWSRLLTGIAVAIPLIVTVWVVSIAYAFIAKISEPFWTTIGVENSRLLNFVSALLLLIGLGFMATHVLGRRLIDAFETLLLRVPLISTVYGAVKQALESFRAMKSNTQFKRVVYVEYPSEGCFLIGFVTGQFTEPAMKKEFTMVFLPTSPNPLTGFIVGIPSDRVVESALTLEQASKLIVSAGLVAPVPSAMTKVVP